MELKNEQALVEYFLLHPIPDKNIPERVHKSIVEPDKHPRSIQISKFVRATENNLYATHDENERFGALLKEPCVFEHLCALASAMNEPYTGWHLETIVKHVLAVNDRLCKK